MEQQNILLAFSLTLFAGLSTGVGGAIAFFAHKTNARFLSAALGFSAGIMVYISFMEILPEAQSLLAAEAGQTAGAWVAVASFFAGMLFIGIIDKLVPSSENPHEAHSVEEVRGTKPADKTAKTAKLLRTGLLTAFAVAVHNFPEGFATFVSTMRDPAMGIGIALAVALHNIPEGIAVSIPVYYATGSRRKAFAYSFLSGIAEPAGALIGYLILSTVLNDLLFGIVFAAIAGIMVYISFDQLLPTAREYGEHHISIYGLLSGMAIMAVSLILFL